MFRKAVAGAVGLVLLVGGAVTAFAAGSANYVVQPGDTLYSLAKRSGTTIAQLVEANGIGSNYVIRVGQTLIIPAAGEPSGPAATTTGKPAQPAQPASDGKSYATMRPVAELKRELLADRGALAARPPVEPVLAAAPSPALPVAEPRPAASSPAPMAPAVEGSDGRPVEIAPAYVIPCTSEERLLLGRLVAAEAGEEPLEGQVGVAAVVVNRVKRPGFPKSVTAVIQEPGQFKSVELGRVEKAVADADALSAVDRALAGEDPTNGAIFFYNPQKSVALDFWRTRPVTVVIGGHNFAK